MVRLKVSPLYSLKFMQMSQHILLCMPGCELMTVPCLDICFLFEMPLNIHQPTSSSIPPKNLCFTVLFWEEIVQLEWNLITFLPWENFHSWTCVAFWARSQSTWKVGLGHCFPSAPIFPVKPKSSLPIIIYFCLLYALLSHSLMHKNCNTTDCVSSHTGFAFRIHLSKKYLPTCPQSCQSQA